MARFDDQHMPTRPVDRDKAESELSIHIKKATSNEESAPKQKHVRKCIVYTWDYRTSQSIWTGLRVQPILSDEVQTFKALILVHKVLQEGHQVVLKEAQAQIGWFETCARTVGADSMRGYGSLIRAYVNFILAKLRFHRHHKEFNGLFEYEEYISLKNIDNPDEGYETIMDLMNLQDQIEQFQKLVFAHFRGSANNECRISALVPLVKESYGMYKFLTSMLRAMHRRTDASDALQPLRERYDSQHHHLRKFYYECANLKYLTSLINVPKLNHDPPNLFELPEEGYLPPPRQTPKAPTPEPGPSQAEIDEQARLLKQYEDKQAALKAQEEAERQRQADLAAKQQRDFEEQQRQQAEQQRLAQEQLMRAQMDQMQGGRLAELEREILAMRGQYERDQLMLEQYDRRVKALETELANIGQNFGAQMQGKDEIIKQLQDQVTLWRNKYEALAKLYSQLRSEHLEMLGKYKQMQIKAGSAQEAVDKMERMERDVKAKNLELADMIRERDRARFDLDRIKASQKEEFDRLKRDLMFANERAEDATRAKSSELSGMMSTLNRQIAELEDSLREKRMELDARDAELARIRDEKDAELAIMQEGMDATIKQLTDMQLDQGANDQAVNAQIDTLILDNTKKLNAIIDSILQACVDKVDDALYELESPSGTGNTTATPEYVLSMIEKGTTSTNEFATVFSLYLSGEVGGEHVEVIKRANQLAQTISDTLTSTKGITRLAQSDDAADKLIGTGRETGNVLLRFFSNLQSYRLAGVAPAQRRDVVARQNMEARSAFANLNSVVETMVKAGNTMLANANGDIGDIVEREMMNAASAIDAATAKLQALLSRPRDHNKYSAVDLQVHDAILEASLAITRAIAGLIKASTESQQEIVAKGRGSSTNQQFYKKNNRWTEGLISAARAVAFATTMLIEAADGVIMGTHSLEQLIVASNEVSAATAQVVAASRVKAEFMSKTQDRLERAAKAVTDACRALVKQVKTITDKQSNGAADFDYSQMAAHEFKVKEMEQQVEVLKLEKELTQARRVLGAMRRAGYHATEED
ncbi:related to cytoskeleton assembly control protein [Ustilago trichophora]|uniref:Related to cytoskeleton assembly control protein n=1 Tax=Ustilago trichophora TaxID=86804 RepID=A0A5C3DRP5_9BASI|nr:related to cytoskeleton assembly control protein [Ustilago trichophora]